MNKKVMYIIGGFFLVYFVFIFIRTVSQSVFFTQQDRINVVMYNSETIVLSFGLTDNVNYIVRFSNDDKVSVPGGYGRYAVGALGRLADIESDYDLIGRTFSSMISGYADYYVMPRDPEVFAEENESGDFKATEYIQRLFSSEWRTNASFLDRIYLSYLIFQKRESDFVILQSISEQSEDGEPLFSERRFTKKYKGFFFHQTLREEGKEVQIQYNSYPGAVTLSRVIEGQGIRVVDLSQTEETLDGRCLIQSTDQKDTGITEEYIAQTFGCEIEEGAVEGADIRLIMGSEITEEWK